MRLTINKNRVCATVISIKIFVIQYVLNILYILNHLLCAADMRVRKLKNQKSASEMRLTFIMNHGCDADINFNNLLIEYLFYIQYHHVCAADMRVTKWKNFVSASEMRLIFTKKSVCDAVIRIQYLLYILYIRFIACVRP